MSKSKGQMKPKKTISNAILILEFGLYLSFELYHLGLI